MIRLLLTLMDFALAENPKGKGRGRTATRGILMLICSAILVCVKDVPAELKAMRAEIAAVDKRVALVELRLGAITPQADTRTNAAHLAGSPK